MKRIIGPVAIVLALVLAVAALLISGVTLYGALQFRQAARASVSDARAALAGLHGYTAEFTVPFQQTFPISAQVPLQRDFVVPIQTTLPFSTVVHVPVSIPILGTYQVAVPVQTEIDVNLQVIIPISETLAVETTVTVDTEVPIAIDMAQLGLDSLLTQVNAALGQLEEGLGGEP
jgi:hypothetical protein